MRACAGMPNMPGSNASSPARQAAGPALTRPLPARTRCVPRSRYASLPGAARAAATSSAAVFGGGGGCRGGGGAVGAPVWAARETAHMHSQSWSVSFHVYQHSASKHRRVMKLVSHVALQSFRLHRRQLAPAQMGAGVWTTIRAVLN